MHCPTTIDNNIVVDKSVGDNWIDNKLNDKHGVDNWIDNNVNKYVDDNSIYNTVNDK